MKEMKELDDKESMVKAMSVRGWTSVEWMGQNARVCERKGKNKIKIRALLGINYTTFIILHFLALYHFHHSTLLGINYTTSITLHFLALYHFHHSTLLGIIPLPPLYTSWHYTTSTTLHFLALYFIFHLLLHSNILSTFLCNKSVFIIFHFSY